ncbi:MULTISPECIES: double-strand break repair helicase AddA [unclassified Xanthobacter]|uniref:double-strand break repair helicase AddA n=1 Tax=unclassified Xanthobacter TaxID=2623496 RepID=UPI001F1B6586|nr:MULTISPECIES: double-strand break repair helicase AddA [unclassified Xanthobacter]
MSANAAAGPEETSRSKEPPSQKEPTGPKAEATRRQSLASDPAHSAWVSANAGSGKTHVLARRVIRLLLSGVKPARILCLTYTKAAAANMSNRVLGILGRWVGLDDAGLDAELISATGERVTPALRARARRLFALALETPGGLKIQTIHAFCGGLLHRFPFEAGVAAGFRELDDVARAELMARIRQDLIIEATSRPDSELGRALAQLMADLADSSITAMLDAAIGQREHIAGLGTGAVERRSTLARVLGVPAGAGVAELEAQMLESPHLPWSEWEAAGKALATSDKKTDQERAAALLAAYESGNPEEARAEYLSVFLTDKREPRADRSLATKFVADNYPDLLARMKAERERLAALEGALRSARVLERTEAALVLGAEACRRYEAEKAQRGLLDFDDLVARASGLLNQVPASFVHYKLDQGIDHVLVDEAQDTSPAQWRVVHGLTSDFFSGEGARPGVKRTIFVVGDEKQSIFSFQGADPRAFGSMRSEFAQKAGAAAFQEVRLPHSFRSAPGVLEAVDRIFAGEDARAGLTLDSSAPVHAAIRADAPALVELWPTTVPSPVPEVDDWRRPLDAAPSDDPVSLLAQRIARFVQAGVRSGLAMPSRSGRAMRAGDVLVLVRRRGRVFEAVIRALKELNDPDVAVAGADRLVVAQHIAALDLMALGDALLSPDDDLALASVLKSPLFGLTDDDLMTLCPGRPGRLVDALAASAEPRAQAATRRLSGWRDEALGLRPFDFYARVLGRDGGRRAVLARLGPEAADVLDEFLALARTYEGAEPASLAGFLAFLRRGGAETKRDMESGRNEVRVMTVHGAKGLEAPLVILADTVDLPRPRTSGGFLRLTAEGGREVPVLAPRKAEDSPALGAARAAAAARDLDEYRRLLYVALTRAEDALIVCGAETALPAKDKDHARPDGCWYELVRTALAPDAAQVPALGFEGTVLRWGKAPLAEAFAAAARASTPAESPAAPAPLTFTAPPPHEAPPRVLRPSRAAPAQPHAKAEAAGVPPLVRGDLVHRLLAGLADIALERREEAGLRLLRHAGQGLDAESHGEILAEAMAVLGHAPLADLFGPQSRPELPVAGHLDLPGAGRVEVNGRIDRLAILSDRILVADFKTDRTPPQNLAGVPRSHVAQLALYGAVLSRVFGGRAVEARLVYTAEPRVFVLDGAALAGALSALSALTSA